MVAKVLNKMKDHVKAEDVCDDIISICTDDQEQEVKKQHKFAVNALYMKAKNMLNVMEFREAKELLEE